MKTKITYTENKYHVWSLTIERENGKQAFILDEQEAQEVVDVLSKHLALPERNICPYCQKEDGKHGLDCPIGG